MSFMVKSYVVVGGWWPRALYCHLLGLGIGVLSISYFPISHFPIPHSPFLIPQSQYPIPVPNPSTQSQAQAQSQSLDNFKFIWTTPILTLLPDYSLFQLLCNFPRPTPLHSQITIVYYSPLIMLPHYSHSKITQWLPDFLTTPRLFTDYSDSILGQSIPC